MTALPLKNYQREALATLGEYCRAVRDARHQGAPRPEREAFERLAGRPYYSPTGFEGAPYVCVRLPTGGGKTLLAAHAIGTIGGQLLGTDRPVCLWITPSIPVREQTLRGLREGQAYHDAVRESLAGPFEVFTLEEALTRPQAVTARAGAVIVTSIQSYRIRDERTGEELAATRRIYRDDGYLQVAFDNLPEWARADLLRDERGLIDLSLANALRLRSPIVIMDEAHDARTPISFESLARFGPSFVLELTATPEQRHDPGHPTEPRYASNVLHAASALEVKNAGMIKLPIELESRGDWLEVLAATMHRREDLERLADQASEDTGLPFIRPVALIQAQQELKRKETHTVQKVKAALIEKLHVPAEYVRICTGNLDEIREEDLLATNCPVRYVITVDRLRQGWDCPLAYVLGSIGNAATPTAVEQLLGRVLRMPFANPTGVEALNRAYAFVLSDDVVATAMDLRDRMVETCGFDERTAADALRVSAAAGIGLGLARIPLGSPPPPGALTPTMTARSRYDEESGTRILDDLPSGRELIQLRDSLSDPADRQAVESFWERERPIAVAARNLGEYARPLRIPRLAVREGGRQLLLEPEELDRFSWDLAACDPGLSEAEFPSETRVGSRATIGFERVAGAERESLITSAGGDVTLRRLELFEEGEDWSVAELARWLDLDLHQGGALPNLMLRESQPWLARVVEHLANERQLGLPLVVRRRHALAQVLRTKVRDHGWRQTRRALELLIRDEPDALETSDEHAIVLEELDYAPLEIVRGHQFQHHAFELVFKMGTEEMKCATRIDGHANVARWLRNTERAAQGGFSLPLAPGEFFVDFIVELKNGQIMLVEYKGSHRDPLAVEQHKKAVGELWAAGSGGKCRFAWVVDEDWQALESKLRDD